MGLDDDFGGGGGGRRNGKHQPFSLTHLLFFSLPPPLWPFLIFFSLSLPPALAFSLPPSFLPSFLSLVRGSSALGAPFKEF